MSEYPTTNLNSELIAAGLNPSDPTNTYVDFADTLARTRQQEQSQEQAIALAQERVKQAKYQTKNETDAQAAGYNEVLKDSMTPAEAEAYLKLVMKAKGLQIEQADIDAWVKALPPQVNRQVVESFANRFARESTRSGQPAMFETKDKISIPEGSTAKDLGLVADANDPQVGHVPEDGMYQVVYDNQGEIKKFIPGGKEPVDPSVKLNAKMAESTEKQWQKLDTVVNGAFKTRSGGLGSLSTAVFRAVRAINTINATDNLTAQDLANIAQDIAGIFQGGAPTVVGMQDNDYKVTFASLADYFRKQTGIMANMGKIFGAAHNPLEPTKRKLLQVCVDLRDSAINNLKSFVESEAPAYKEIIDANPERWASFEKEKLKFIESGLLVPSYSKSDPSVGASPLNITGIDEASEVKPPHDVTKAPEKSVTSTKSTDANDPLGIRGK